MPWCVRGYIEAPTIMFEVPTSPFRAGNTDFVYKIAESVVFKSYMFIELISIKGSISPCQCCVNTGCHFSGWMDVDPIWQNHGTF